MFTFGSDVTPKLGIPMGMTILLKQEGIEGNITLNE